MASGTVKVPLRIGSDGDASHVPTNPATVEAEPTIYLEKLAMLWMKDRQEGHQGINYVLERLPHGYRMFQRARPSDPSHVDKWLYGHPGHKPFDSPNRFYPHFKHLMENGGDSMGCPCTVCNAKGGVIRPISSASTSSKARGRTPAEADLPKAAARAPAYQPKGRPKQVSTGEDMSRIDEEGTPDVYRNLIDKLKKYGKVDEAIKEPLSMDWRAEQECLPKMKEDVKRSALYLPRVGEIVFFIRRLEKGITISCDRTSSAFKLYDTNAKVFVGTPKWEVGLVGQAPVEQTDLDDLVHEPQKEMSVSYSGVRVEPLPSSESASTSTQHQYVALHQTRPFVFWKEYLHGIPEEEWHPTIHAALTKMSTFSLVNKYRFKGVWPKCSVYCRGLFVGPEVYAIGDVVRLLPKSGETACADMLVVRTIRLQLKNLDKASDNDYDEGRPYNSELYLYGKGYTVDPHRSSKEWLSMDDENKPAVMEGYEAYPLHPSDKELQVPFSRVLGRLYSADAMSLWLPSLSDPDGLISPREIEQGWDGTVEARRFAKNSDPRIVSEIGANWYWGDNRADALSLMSINGLDVGEADKSRDPKSWRSAIKVLQVEAARDRESNRLQRFMAPTSLPNASRPSSSGGSQTSNPVDKKRAKVFDLTSDAEDEIQIRQQTKILSRDAGNKRSRVSVVIE